MLHKVGETSSGLTEFRSFTLVALLLIALIAGLGPTATTLRRAQGIASAQPPSFPVLYAGRVKILKGDKSVDAPVGAVVSARVGGSEKGRIVATQPGRYGEVAAGGGTIFSALLVQGNLAPGDRIDFFVNNVRAAQSDSYVLGAEPRKDFLITAEDNLPPLITSVQPASGSTVGPEVTVRVTYMDELAGIDVNSANLRLGDSPIVPTAKDASGLTLTRSLAVGNHTVSVSVNDNLGNTASQTWSFTVAQGAPSGPPPVGPPPQTLAGMIETLPAAQAAREVAQAPIAQAVQALQQASVTKAAEVTALLPAARAADIINQIDVARAAEIVSRLDAAKAAEIVGQVDRGRAIDAVERMAAARAAQIMELVSADMGAQIAAGMSSLKAGDLLSAMATGKAAQVMERVPPARLEQMLPAMPAKALLERLPEIPAARLYELRPQTLFQLLPGVPAEHLVKETPPAPGRGMDKPPRASSSASVVSYKAPQTRAGEWTVLAEEGPPGQVGVTAVMARFRTSLSEVSVNLEAVGTLPAQAPNVERSGQKVNGYFSIGLAQEAAKAVDVGHIRFRIAKEWLKTNQAHKWSIVLSRYENGIWTPLPTRRVDEDGSFVYYTATTPQFSLFAVTGGTEIPAPAFRVSRLEVGPAAAAAGQPVKVIAEITSLASDSRSLALPLWLNGTVESSQIVVLPAGGKAELTYAVTREAGSYEIRMDRQFRPLQVGAATPTSAPTAAPTAAPTQRSPATPSPASPITPTAPAGPPSAGPPLWVGILGGVAAGGLIVTVISLLVRRRKRA